LFSPHEMGATRTSIEKKVNANATYRTLFQKAFPMRAGKGISIELIIEAISDFERTLISLNSRYDQFVFGDTTAMNAAEYRGFNVFRSFVTRCTECHEPPLFTNFQVANIGAPDLKGLARDLGVGKVRNEDKHNGAFRIPSLRNIANTAPYMHSGAFKSLMEVLNFYDLGGGRALPGYDSPYIHWHITRMGLRKKEKRDLLIFLGTLTDESGMPAIPKKVPSGLPMFQKEGEKF